MQLRRTSIPGGLFRVRRSTHWLHAERSSATDRSICTFMHPSLRHHDALHVPITSPSARRLCVACASGLVEWLTTSRACNLATINHQTWQDRRSSSLIPSHTAGSFELSSLQKHSLPRKLRSHGKFNHLQCTCIRLVSKGRSDAQIDLSVGRYFSIHFASAVIPWPAATDHETSRVMSLGRNATLDSRQPNCSGSTQPD